MSKPHWIITDYGFGGCCYRCSECGSVEWDIHRFDKERCPTCKAPMDDEAEEYIEFKTPVTAQKSNTTIESLWSPVINGLPTENGLYIVTIKSKRGHHVDFARFDARIKRFAFDDDNFLVDITGVVTAWMNKPKAYKEKNPYEY